MMHWNGGWAWMAFMPLLWIVLIEATATGELLLPRPVRRSEPEYRQATACRSPCLPVPRKPVVAPGSAADGR